jgi:AraC-like DNA-binding protein
MHARPKSGLSSIPTATGGIARLACALLRERGKDVRPVMTGAGLTIQDVENPECRLRASAQLKVLELAARELQDDYLGFRLARDFELGEIGLVYYVMASSERLVDALQNAERYCAINNEGVHLRTSTNGDLTIGFEYLHVDRHSDRHHAEFWLVALLRICRTLTADGLLPRKITLRHERAQVPADVGRHLGCKITYAADRDEMSFAAEAGALAVVGADTHLNRLLLRYAHEALGQRAIRRDSLRSRVEDHLVQLLPNGRANVSDVARRLGMSRRTLARALSEEKASYSAILGDLRQALAKRYLREGSLPVSEIAWLLGYREVSSFTNAFTGWTGQTPREFRASASA